MKRLAQLSLLGALLLPGFLHSAETTIKGGRMELMEKGNKVVFTGGVTLERSGDTLKAIEMTTNKDRDKVLAAGNVQLFRRMSSTETLQAFGDRGQYETNSGKGYLEGKKDAAHLVHTVNISTSADRVVHIYASRIDFSNPGQSAVATGAVNGSSVDPETGETYEFWAETATWEGIEKKLILTGTPYPLVKQTAGDEAKTISGERIIYYLNSKKFISEGSSKAVFVDSTGRSVQ